MRVQWGGSVSLSNSFKHVFQQDDVFLDWSVPDTEDALDDLDIREKVKENIESAFKNNELIYERKLFLIENCIHGVDIQPISIQISKFRFLFLLSLTRKPAARKKTIAMSCLCPILKPSLWRQIR
jgi:hypothetical protein